MQTTARRLSVVSATSCARCRLIRDVRSKMDTFQHWLETGMNECDSEIEFSPQDLVCHFTRFHREIGRIRDDWSDSQLAKGIRYLYGSGSCYLAEMSQLSPSSEVDRFFASVPHLYTDLFEVRCSRFFSHLGRGPEQPNPLNGPCYMLWDMDGGIDSFRFSKIPEHIGQCIRLLEHLTNSIHPATIESAIHGLGHMIDDFRGYCQPPLERVALRSDIPIELRVYANDAVHHHIQ